MSGVELVVYAAATFRLAWLVTHDYLLHPIRDRLIRFGYRDRAPTVAALAKKNLSIDATKPGAWSEIVEGDDAPPKLAYIWTCPFCASVWCAALLEVARTLSPEVTFHVAAALAFSAAASVVASYIDD